MRTMRPALLCLALAATACQTALSDPPSGWRGNVYFGDSASVQLEKVFVASYRVTGSGFESLGASIQYGAPARLPGSAADYAVAVIGADGRARDSYTIWDPRKAVVENAGIVVNDSGAFVARLAFSRDARAIRITTPDGALVTETDLAPALQAFCRAAARDPDCGRGPG